LSSFTQFSFWQLRGRPAVKYIRGRSEKVPRMGKKTAGHAAAIEQANPIHGEALAVGGDFRLIRAKQFAVPNFRGLDRVVVVDVRS
jgi:hypothetical protein